MRRTPAILVSILLILAVQSLSLNWGVTYDWPDFFHVNYGFPLVWATHTLNTIIGPVDRWSVDLGNLLLDMLFWDGILIVLVAVLAIKMKN